MQGLEKSSSPRFNGIVLQDFAPGQIDAAAATVVTFRVEILSLDDIRELGMTLNVQFRLTLSWTDPRLVFFDLKDAECGDDEDASSASSAGEVNALTSEEKERIWTPRIVFNNTDDENESLVDAKAMLTVVKKVEEFFG